MLGYAVQVPRGDEPIATFPPTSLKLVTNQYQAGTPDNPVRDPELDMVTYLMMTADRRFPAEFTPWWGNFVPSDGKDDTWYGTIAMARQVLMDKFLLAPAEPAGLRLLAALE